MSSTVNYHCDLCKKPIVSNDDDHVNAQVYGVDFHLQCILPAIPILKVMGIDDVTFRGEKLIYYKGVIQRS